jgi:hypothetical protein
VIGFSELTAAYDEVMGVASEPDFKTGSTTTRMSDLLNYGSAFDDIYFYPPLLEACSHIIGEPFKLSSFFARTLIAGTPSQELHGDLARGCEDASYLDLSSWSSCEKLVDQDADSIPRRRKAIWQPH